VLSGISQLPALLSLVRLYSADVDLCNVDGMTPLMLAASAGDCILVNVSFWCYILHAYCIQEVSKISCWRWW